MTARIRAVPETWLLRAGIAAGVVYVLGDVTSAMLYDRYRYRDQAISELTAFGSPVRPLMVTVIMVHNLLLLAFGIGVLRVARTRSVQWIGILQIADLAIVGLPTHTFWAMSSRGTETGFNDTMHIALSAVFSLLVLTMMVLSAIGRPGWFRVYAVATTVLVTAAGVGASLAIRGIDRDHTPWAGALERVDAYATFLWLAVLAAALIRDADGRHGGRTTHAPSSQKPIGTARESSSRPPSD